MGAKNFEILAEDSNTGGPSSFTVRMEYLRLICWGRNHYFVNFCSLASVALIVDGWGVVGWGRKSYLGPAEFASFSSRDLNRRIKYDSIWLVVFTGYFYILVLRAIVVSDFLPLEIHKHLDLLLSSITCRANSQVGNPFCKYI